VKGESRGKGNNLRRLRNVGNPRFKKRLRERDNEYFSFPSLKKTPSLSL